MCDRPAVTQADSRGVRVDEGRGGTSEAGTRRPVEDRAVRPMAVTAFNLVRMTRLLAD